MISKPTLGVDAKKLASDLSNKSLGTDRLEKVIKDYLLVEGSIFLILLDDTDQIASPDDTQHLNRIWGLLLAVRKLTSKNPNIKCIITLRTEVWLRLLRNERGQRDQIDHFRPLELTLRAPEGLIRSIFNRRIGLAVVEDGCDDIDPMRCYFESDWMTLPTSTKRRSWDQFLLKSSRERPRDMIQLVNHLATQAISRGNGRIGDKDAELAMRLYSEERTKDLAIEMGYDCQEFLDVIRSFADLEFECSFEVLRKHLRNMPSRFSLSINNQTMKPNDDIDAIKLLSLLHESGFLNPRVSDNRQTKNYRHITFLDDSNLVQMSRWNELQSATWEVHPAFRTYLLGLKKSQSWK